jgi:ribosomal 50S subunit-recycling heat shock protein
MLLQQRTAAKELCDRQFIKVNGQYIKPSRHINIGDVIQIETTEGMAQYRVLMIPGGNVRKGDRELYYQEITGADDEPNKAY